MSNVTTSADVPSPGHFDAMRESLHGIDGCDHYAIENLIIDRERPAGAYVGTIEELPAQHRDPALAVLAETSPLVSSLPTSTTTRLGSSQCSRCCGSETCDSTVGAIRFSLCDCRRRPRYRRLSLRHRPC
jgi:hypothetical protein